MADVVLDYNQVIEETPVTGDTLPSSGGLVTFQFKCDVNGATDLSNSFFAADCNVKSVGITDAALTRYIPDGYDFHAFPMLRVFQSVTHIIDGQTVCNSQHPYADAVIVEKFLTTHSKANLENFQSLSLMKQIDNGMKEYNIFTFDKPAVDPSSSTGGYRAWIYDWAKPGLFSAKYASGAETTAYVAAGDTLSAGQNAAGRLSDATVTMLFQPPFDLWRLRQPFHGGIHQVQFNLKPADSVLGYGGYMTTTCVGLSRKGALLYDMPRGSTGVFSASSFQGPLSGFPVRVAADGATAYDLDSLSPFAQPGDAAVVTDATNVANLAIKAAQLVDRVYVDIKRLRFLRRVIRTSVPPQLSNVQYNFTEIAMQHGTPTSQNMSQQFLLPSTTFGLIFYWREATNSYYDQVGLHPVVERIESSWTGADEAFLSQGIRVKHINAADIVTSAFGAADEITVENMYRTRNVEMNLQDFQFTYGGATYPMQRIKNVSGGISIEDGETNPYGWHRMMTLQNQLQGVYNSTMDDFPQSYGHGYGKGLLGRMDPHMMFFPVSRTGNSDNGILQVEYSMKTRRPLATNVTDTAGEAVDLQLVVVALYDAQLNMQYSSNELQQIVLTQFK